MDCFACGNEVEACPICGSEETDHSTDRCFRLNEMKQFMEAERIARNEG